VAPGGPLPEPAELLDLPAIRLLLDHGAIVICAGGGGGPVVTEAGQGGTHGVEAVVDKDLTAALLARQLHAGPQLPGRDGRDGDRPLTPRVPAPGVSGMLRWREP
jgi:hypothetical protein